ncbi:MAG TPA: response regulator [Gammaproteobacteria bacterium]|nr:response regulator [Gammaproteobacteria bacterium]
MNSNNDLDLNTLIWVKSEIDETLTQARKALEVFIEDESDTSQIQFCLNYLHQVRGTLQMVELYGSAMAAEEVENLVQALIDGKVSNRNDAFEVLIRGVLQLPDYLEHLLEGHADTPMLLLPLLNDLRAARGAPLLSENAMFTPDLGITAPLAETIDGNLAETLIKLRHHYHLGLLGWFRDKDDTAGLRRIAGVLNELRKVAHEQEIGRLLWVAHGLVESLIDTGLDSSVSVKLLLGQLDRQFKKIIDYGEHALNVEPPSELLKNILYYVATSASRGQLTDEIKQAFKLDEILPDMGSLEQARADMAAPNAALMSTVSSVLMEDLLRVKDNLDLFVRSDERDIEQLQPLKETLLQIADTLGMLGLGIQRESVQQQIESISAMQANSQEVDDSRLMEMAGAMLDLENSLNEISAARAANVKAEEGIANVASHLMQDAEQQKLLKTVVKEARFELDQVKDAINLFSKNPADHSPLEMVPAALDRIKGGISILSLDRAADLLQGCILYIRQNLLEGGNVPEADVLDSLADAISSIEYYLESLAGKWGQPDAILDVAEYSLKQLQGETADKPNDDLVTLSELKQPDREETVSLHSETEDDNDTLIDIPAPAPETDESELNDQSITETLEYSHDDTEDETLHDLSVTDLPQTDSVDDIELNDESQLLMLDIEGFDSIDEAVVGEDDMRDSVPVDTDAEVQQGRPETVADLSVDSVAADELTDEQGPASLAELNQEAADSHSDEPEISSSRLGINEPAAAEKLAVMDEIDDEIIEIFLEEAEEEYERISELLPKLRQNPDDADALAELRRAFHTLKGSGRLVGALDIGEFAWAYENMLNRVIDQTISPSDGMFNLLEQARQVLPGLFELFKQGEKPDAAILTLIDHVNLLSQGELLPEETAEEADESVAPDSEKEAEAASEDDIDPVLLDIYRKEVETHLLSLQEYIHGWENGRYREPTQTLMRALHTLTGSSRTTGVIPVAELSAQFEHYVNELLQLEAQMNADALSLLNDSIDYIRSVTDALEQTMPEADSNRELIARLQTLFETIAEAPITAEIMAHDKTAIDVSVGAMQEPKYDEDLLEIFIEEGVEILDACDTTLHHWRQNPENQDDIEVMQRYLHTLKGGARMAGVRPVGDLSHNIESMLTLVAEGRQQVSENMFVSLQRAQDRLVLMLEQLKARQNIPDANDIIAEVDALIAGKATTSTDAEATIETEVSDSRAQTSEPLDLSSAGEITEKVESKIESTDSSAVVKTPGDETEAAPEIDRSTESEPEQAAIEVADTNLEAPVNEADRDDNVAPFATTASVDEDSSVSVEARKDERRQTSRKVADQIRVRAELLDDLVNFAGEVSIYRSRMEQQANSFGTNLQELDETVARLREQLRQFEIETETQIQYRREETVAKNNEDFDPLEFDRFTQMQHLSRTMLESLNDLDSLRGILSNINRESETLLLQQSRVNTDLQEGLMRTRLVPFTSQAPRLRRIVRQISEELGKKIRLELEGLDNELDRTVMERIIPPLEHMLRNAVAHGIELPQVRLANGKPESGKIRLSFQHEGSDIVISIADDGAGLDYDAIINKAVETGLLSPDAEVSRDILQTLIMESGFSTAEKVSQISGRGVGMDVVNAAIKQMGGVVDIESESGKGTCFTLSLPLTLAITRALMVNVAEEIFSLPLLSVQGVERISVDEINALQAEDRPVYEWLGEEFRVMNLAGLIGLQNSALPDDGQKLPLLMVRSGDYRAAILVDGLLGTREIVVKPVGPQLSSLRGVAGATIMGDGSVVLILDLGILIRRTITREIMEAVPAEVAELERLTVMVVDDSITVRKVTTRLLERNDYDVLAAKDGVDALGQLLEVRPDIMLLDIEMPRMDGFELATNMRNDEELKNIPIIMITSRTGDKHRDRAFSIGVNKYMGKPFSEDELLVNIRALTENQESV